MSEDEMGRLVDHIHEMSETQQPAVQPWASLDDFKQSAERDPALVHLLRYSVTQDQGDWSQVLPEGQDSYYTAYIRRAIVEQDAELARLREQVGALDEMHQMYKAVAAMTEKQMTRAEAAEARLERLTAERDRWKARWAQQRAGWEEADRYGDRERHRAEAAEARLVQVRAAAQQLTDPTSPYAVGTSTYAYKVLTDGLAATAPAPAPMASECPPSQSAGQSATIAHEEA